MATRLKAYGEISWPLVDAVLNSPTSEAALKDVATWLSSHGDPMGGLLERSLAGERPIFLNMGHRFQGTPPSWRSSAYGLEQSDVDRLAPRLEEWYGEILQAPKPWPDYGPIPKSGWRAKHYFVQELHTSLDWLVERGAALFQTWPVTHLVLDSIGTVQQSRENFYRLQPNWFARLQRLSLRGMGLGDAEAQLIAQWSSLTNLKSLSLGHNDFTAIGVEALAASPYLAEVVHLELEGNNLKLFENREEYGWFGENMSEVVPTPLNERLRERYPRNWLIQSPTEQWDAWQ